MAEFTKQTFEPCATQKQLTSIEQNFEENVVRLIFHDDAKSIYLKNSSAQLKCWYKEIVRDNEVSEPDKHYKLKEPQFFDKSINLPSPLESIIVQCNATYKSVEINSTTEDEIVYKNAHIVVRRTPERAKILNNFKTLYPQKKPLSVLMIGIDSISRLNLLRAMPNTSQYLHQNNWFELDGYNKNGYNTFPNLMAILTGIDFENEPERLYKGCGRTAYGGLDKCQFLWNYFEQIGYATAYAEDEQYMQTFNYCQSGFVKSPTTHHFRNFALAAEDLFGNRPRLQCLFNRHYADYVYQYAIDFATAYKNDSFFGLFWTNTFSHDWISEPSSMDDYMKNYLEQMDEKGILNSSAVIFFSDHGPRYGPFREKLHSGWYEERLPFIYIWLPKYFQEENPDFVRSLKKNRNRLTSTFDLHMTLKHILELTGRVGILDPPEGCAKCQSLFRDIPLDRSCSDAGLPINFCACSDFRLIEKSNEDLEKYANFVLGSINNEIVEITRSMNSTTWKCANLTLRSIESVSCSKSEEDSNKYLIKLEALPSEAVFEAIIRENDENNFKMIGRVSRLNKYGNQGDCVDDSNHRNYCFCQKNE